MAIYTPKGLKVRLTVAQAFALMSRLYPNVKPFDILKRTEAIDLLPATMSFITALAFFSAISNLSYIGIAIILASTIGILMNKFGFYFIPGIIRLAATYSFFAGFGVLFITAIVYSYIRVGWKGPVVYLAASAFSGIIGWAEELLFMKRAYSATGFPITGAERSFFNAYRLYAVTFGMTTDISLSDEELDDANWKPVFNDFSQEWPQVAARFSHN